MKWNEHKRVGDHALLAPSAHYWINYDRDKLSEYISSVQAKDMGTRLHALAAELISLRRRQRNTKDTLDMYVNDAIGFDMDVEILLYYSDYIFGHADAIAFDGKKLRIHDLKTGKLPASMDQLRIYAALFCLEYGQDPESIEIELRIYQLNDKKIEKADPMLIRTYMNRIIDADKLVMEKLGE